MSRKKKFQIPFTLIRIIVISIVVLTLGVFGVFRLIYVIHHASYFKITSISKDASLSFINKRDLSKLMGQNIFLIDLKDVQTKLSYKYPQVSDLKVSRRFPDKIVVTARSRDPFAQLFLNDKIITLDEKGIVLSTTSDKSKALPFIDGASDKNRWTNIGLPLKGRDVYVALEIITAFVNQEDLSSYQIVKLNISNLSKISFNLRQGLEVFIDDRNVDYKIKVLSFILTEGGINLDEVKYIDLRFKEPILGKK